MASIAEENAASNQEVLSTIENENSQIIQIGKILYEIRELSEDLKNTVSYKVN